MSRLKKAAIAKKTLNTIGFTIAAKDQIKVDFKLVEVAFYYPPSFELSDITIYVIFYFLHLLFT